LSPAFFTTSGVLAPALFCRGFIMEHVSRTVGITVDNNSITDLDYVDDVVLFVEQASQYVEV